MLWPWMLSSQNRLDYGRHHGWAMDALFSSQKVLDHGVAGTSASDRSSTNASEAWLHTLHYGRAKGLEPKLSDALSNSDFCKF